MTEPTLAIDFGTSRTKAAWKDERGEIHLLKWNGIDYLPSLFYLPWDTKEILLGVDALEAYEFDPDHVIEQLKQILSESDNSALQSVNPVRKIKYQELLNLFFKYIADKARVLPAFESGLGEVVVTLPVNCSMELRKAIELASSKQISGFKTNTIISESEAVARAWFLGNEDDSALLILDCGDTTNWVLMINTQQGYEVSKDPAFKAKNISLGGTQVDEALVRHIISSENVQLPDNSHIQWLKGKVQRYKERVLSNEQTRPIRLQHGNPAPLTPEITTTIYCETFVQPVLKTFSIFLKNAIQAYPDLILLVIGGSAASPLIDSLSKLHSNIHFPKNHFHMLVTSVLTEQISKESSVQKTIFTPSINDDLKALYDINTNPLQRLNIGDRLLKSDEPYLGIGLDKKGMPNIDWVEISGGSFIYGESSNKEKLTIDSFYISRYPITNTQFGVFVENGGYEAPRWWQNIRQQRPVDSAWLLGNRPKEKVSWFEAVAYTRWLSAQLNFEVRLPTEQEWEKAARGTEGKKYPWGNKYKAGYANVNEEKKRNGLWALKQTVGVGLFPHGASPYGVMDMTGNVREWCINKASTQMEDVIDSSDVGRILRGGSWYVDPESACCAIPGYDYPDSQFNDVGFRIVCAYPKNVHINI